MKEKISSLVTAASEEFTRKVKEFGSDEYKLKNHVPEVLRWAKICLKHNTDADEEILLTSVWLHDIGHFIPGEDIDHAIRSEQVAKELLSHINIPEERKKAILHCVRSHRNKDVKPLTKEAKLLTFADSASHMTDGTYLAMAQKRKQQNKSFTDIYEKIERDMRDVSQFEICKEQLTEMKSTWQKLLKIIETIE
jgi:hypothetical protein